MKHLMYQLLIGSLAVVMYLLCLKGISVISVVNGRYNAQLDFEQITWYRTEEEALENVELLTSSNGIYSLIWFNEAEGIDDIYYTFTGCKSEYTWSGTLEYYDPNGGYVEVNYEDSDIKIKFYIDDYHKDEIVVAKFTFYTSLGRKIKYMAFQISS